LIGEAGHEEEREPAEWGGDMFKLRRAGQCNKVLLT
jgi:hypothetical protein